MRHRSGKHWIFKGALFLVLGTAAAFLFTFITMSLWNTLMPELFGLKALGFWQALGLLVLSWLFFGRFRGMGHHGRHRIVERWMRMSPGEREKFRHEMHHGWGRHHHQDEPPSGDAA